MSNSNSHKKVYFVNGMHCSSCEMVIENEITKLNNVEKANVSLHKNCVEIISNDGNFPGTDYLNDLFKDLGYRFQHEKPAEPKLNKTDFIKVIAVFLVFLGAFYLFENSGILMRYSISPSSAVSSYFVFGLMAGLSSCAALVGGILLSLSGNWNSLYNGNSKKSRIPFVYFNLSRILAFALFGALLGLLGSFVKISVTASSVLTIVTAIVMLIIGFQMLGLSWFQKISFNATKGLSRYITDQNNLKSKYVPILIGALTFFIPCGFTLIAQTNALSSGSALRGLLILTAFSMGTLPILALISFSSIKLYSNPVFAKKFSLFSGLLITFFALYTFNSQLNTLGLPSLNDFRNVFAVNNENSQQTVAAQEDFQIMRMEASGFTYSPRLITIRAKIKTRWEIYNSGASGCAQAVYSKGLYPSVIYLKPGLNNVEFNAPKTGTYKISCSMGMVSPVTVKVI